MHCHQRYLQKGLMIYWIADYGKEKLFYIDKCGKIFYTIFCWMIIIAIKDRNNWYMYIETMIIMLKTGFISGQRLVFEISYKWNKQIDWHNRIVY